MELAALIQSYVPYGAQEQRDKAAMLAFLAQNGDSALRREQLTAHFTASAWVVNPQRTKTLMVYHNLYHSWSWTGGHADGEPDLCAVALRELAEETGVRHPRLVQAAPCSLEQLTVLGHVKRGEYVPSHLHLNLTWLVEVEEDEALTPCAGENSAVRWLTTEEALRLPTEPWMVEWVYTKLTRRYMK
jgi:ADP-ribose pyrophosphatase YjhB (NUDIX family)